MKKTAALFLAIGISAGAGVVHVAQAPPIVEQKPDVKRSGSWPRVRAEFLKAHPTCAACGRRDRLEVHHVEPFSRSPEKELDPNNLITLCDGPGAHCHYMIGHLCSWKSFNPDVRADAARYLAKIQARPPPERKE